MQNDDAETIDTAIGWHLRQPTMDAQDWTAFVAWLEADPTHASAYDRVAADDRLLADGAAFPAIVAPARAPYRPARRWAWGIAGSAIAAGIVALALPFALPSSDSRYTITTRPGQSNAVRLADGTRIALNGGTRLTLDRGDPRLASLDAGEATFHVIHDAAAPFTLHAGDTTIRDLGTVFNVVREPHRLAVAVASGSVTVQPDGDAVVLVAGDALTVRDDRHLITRGHVAADTVGGWRDGHLAFAGDRLDTVVAAIERRDGTRVALAPRLSARPFTGMVTLSGSADRDIPHLATLIGATARRDGEQWVIAP